MNFLGDGGAYTGQQLVPFNYPPLCDYAGSNSPIYIF